MNTKTIIGIAGKMASGKGTVASFLNKKYNAQRIKASKPLRNILDQFYIPQKRENLQKLSTLLRNGFGKNILINRVVREMSDSQENILVFDGIRLAIDLATLRTLPHFIFIYVDLSPEERYKRYVQRGENPGDAEMSYEEFLKEDSAEPEQEIESLKEQADYCISSSAPLEQFNQELDSLFQKIL